MVVLKGKDKDVSAEFEALENATKVRFSSSQFQKLVINDLVNSTSSRSVIKSYKQSEVRDMVENYRTEENQKRLVEISEMLYSKSPHYKRLIQYYAYMALFSYVLVPKRQIDYLPDEDVKKDYSEIAEFLAMMDIKHTFSRILETAFVSDIYYGYVHKTKNDFYIQKFDNKICKITSVEFGVYNFSIDMRVFEKDRNKLIHYPREVQNKFLLWEKAKEEVRKSGKTINNWVELDGKNTICIKINENMLEAFPPFAGSFDSIFDIEAFKDLRKNKEELANYMLLSQKVPIRTESGNDNDFAIDMDMLTYFHNMITNNVPENVGVVTSPMDVEAIKFDKDRLDSDGVNKAQRDFWSASGTSQALFSTEENTSQGILMSIKTDEQIVFSVLSQIERWINRYLYFNFKKTNFQMNIIHVTYFSQKDVYDTYLNGSTYGVPMKFHVASVLGLEPIQTLGLAHLENKVFKLHEQFIPLASSHTMSSSDTLNGNVGGRPKAEDSGGVIADETLRGRDKPDSLA